MSSNLKEVYSPLIEYYEMSDEVWEVLLTCEVHMYSGDMLAAGAHLYKIRQLKQEWLWLLISSAPGIT